MNRIDMEQAYALADKLYEIGYRDARAERSYDPRGVTQWQSVVDALLCVVPPKPDFYVACGRADNIGELIALPGYSDYSESGVKHRVLVKAREEGYKGTADARLAELGWEVLPARIVRSTQ